MSIFNKCSWKITNRMKNYWKMWYCDIFLRTFHNGSKLHAILDHSFQHDIVEVFETVSLHMYSDKTVSLLGDNLQLYFSKQLKNIQLTIQGLYCLFKMAIAWTLCSARKYMTKALSAGCISPWSKRWKSWVTISLKSIPFRRQKLSYKGNLWGTGWQIHQSHTLQKVLWWENINKCPVQCDDYYKVQCA